MSSFLDATRLQPSEVAARCGVHVSTIWRWISVGVHGARLRAIRIGGRRFVQVDDLQAFLAAIQDAAPHQHSSPSEASMVASQKLKEQFHAGVAERRDPTQVMAGTVCRRC